MTESRRVLPLTVACVVAGAAWASPALADADPPRTEDAGCAIERHEGISDADAAGVEEIVCSLVRSSGARGRHRVRVTKLGGRVILTLRNVDAPAQDERQLVLSDVGEVTVAAPRLLEASAERKPVAETMDVTNVVGEETRTLKKRPSMVHGWLGMVGVGAAGRTGAGANVGLSAGTESWSFVGDLRLAGEAFNAPAAIAGAVFTLGALEIDPESDFTFVSLSGGARHHFLRSDFSPFLGLGLGLTHVGYGNRTPQPYSGTSYAYSRYDDDIDLQGKTGLAGYTEVGLDLLRTRTVGGTISFRADLPAFGVDETKPDPADNRQRLRRTVYAPVLAVGFALRF